MSTIRVRLGPTQQSDSNPLRWRECSQPWFLRNGVTVVTFSDRKENARFIKVKVYENGVMNYLLNIT